MKHRIVHLINETYGGISKQVWTLAIAMFINRCGSMVLIFMSVYLTQQLKFSISQAGSIMACWGIGSLFGAFVGGRLVDKLGYYPILISSIILSGLALIAISMVHSFIPLCFVVFLVTATGDAYRPASSVALMRFTSDNEFSRSVVLNRLAMNLGFSIAPLIGGFLAKKNYPLLFWLDGLTCIAAGLFLYYLIPNKTNVSKKNKATTPLSKNESPYVDNLYLVFLFICMTYATCFFQFFSSIPLYFKTVCHLPENRIGYLFAMNGIIVAVCEMFLINYIKNKWSKINFISLGYILLSISFVLLLISKSYSIFILFFMLITISEMFAMPFMSDFSMQRSKANTVGQYMALYSMSWSLAQIISPIIGTRIADHYGFQTLWYVIIGITVFSFISLRIISKKLEAKSL